LLQVQVLVSRIALAHLRGRAADEDAMAARLADLAGRFKMYGAIASRAVHQVAVDFEDGSVAGHLDVLESAVRDLGLVGYRPAIALAKYQRGQVDEAVQLLRFDVPPPPDYTWMAWAAMTMLAALETGLVDVAARVRELLIPYREAWCVIGSTVSVMGCVEQLLGEAALELGDVPDGTTRTAKRARPTGGRPAPPVGRSGPVARSPGAARRRRRSTDSSSGAVDEPEPHRTDL
jgi:hypothetical protein